MSIKKLSFMLLSALSLAAMLNGCGSSSKEGTASNASLDAIPKVDEAACAQCHGSSYNSQSGMPIYSEYVQSKHFSNAIGEVVGCQNCHGGGAQHNGVGPIPYSNPDASGKCFGCHKNYLNTTHFYNITGAGVHNAMYVTKNFENGCTACHEPHNPLKGKGAAERKAWAESGHGNVSSLAFADEDFKGNTSCLRCHTSTGFVNYVKSNFVVPTASWATAGDNGREVLTCRTCHNNDSFSVSPAGAFTTPYVANGGVGVNGVAGTALVTNNLIPNVGESNLCIPCHTGRASQTDILGLSDAAMSNTSFKNPHYMPAAGIMYMKTGFISFTSANAFAKAATASAPALSYGGTYTLPLTRNAANTAFVRGGVDAKYGGIIGGVTSAHRALGTNTILLAESWITDAATLNGNKGPCVTCHINANVAGMPAVTDITAAPFLPAGTVIPIARTGSGHSLSAVSSDASRQTCLPCHNDAQELNSTNPALGAEEKLAEAKPSFLSGLAAITNLLGTRYNITFDNTAYPYFFEKGTTTAVKDWTRSGASALSGTLTPARAKKLMGACYNLKMMSSDAGAYVHGRTYVTRLIFDSVDFLDDGVMNTSAATALRAFDPVLFPPAAASWLFSAAGARK
jgi:hypothetical protein